MKRKFLMRNWLFHTGLYSFRTDQASRAGSFAMSGWRKTKAARKWRMKLRYHPIKINTSSARSAFPIHGAVIAEWQLRQAAQTVFDRKAYRVVTNNCQHFCIDVLVELNRNWPDMVPAQAIIDVQVRGTKFTKMTTFFTRFRFQREQKMLEAQRAQLELRDV